MADAEDLCAETMTHDKLQILPPSYEDIDHSVQNSYPTEFHHQHALSFSEPYPEVHCSPQCSYPTSFQDQYASSCISPYSQVPSSYPTRSVDRQATHFNPGSEMPVTSGAASAVTSESDPQHYLGLSIFAALCCCLPLGLVAICFSNAAMRAILKDDRKSAQRNGSCALIFSVLSIIIGFMVAIFIILQAKSRS